MDQEKHWNALAPSYNDEIFDVFKNDRNKVLQHFFKRHGNPNHRAIDFGCGLGKAFPYIAPLFKEILAVDISDELLSVAKSRPFKNIHFQQADLAMPDVDLEPSEFVFSCNVIMLPEIQRNEIMIGNIQRALKKGGHCVVVVPSFESIFYSSWRLIQMYRKKGVAAQDIPSDEFDYFKAKKRRVIQGIMFIDGVPTKHYMEPELKILFSQAGLTVTAIEKVEYSWNSEFDTPPDWMKEPYPWDWLIECTK